MATKSPVCLARLAEKKYGILRTLIKCGGGWRGGVVTFRTGEGRPNIIVSGKVSRTKKSKEKMGGKEGHGKEEPRDVCQISEIAQNFPV